MIHWFDLMTTWVLPVVAVLLAAFAAGMFKANLPLFTDWKAPQGDNAQGVPSVSVLIPARDEAGGIRTSLQAALQSQNVDLEIVVMDDHSSDATADIVLEVAAQDTRVRLIRGTELPNGWNGKQHACYRLASEAKYDQWLFLDADVRLEPHAIAELSLRKAQPIGPKESTALLSAFPHQETGTLLEKLLIPMMHQVLLCYLPFSLMRASTQAGFAAGCGQMFFTDRESYQISGTHQAIQASRHDGLKLPGAYRNNDLMTDCVDGTSLAQCRMYRSASEVIRGLLKNASEGMANPRLLFPFTTLLGGAHVLPWITLGITVAHFRWAGIAVSCLAITLSYVPRCLAMVHFRQSILGTILHPLAVLLFLLLQWWAFANSLLGKQVAWRGRMESSQTDSKQEAPIDGHETIKGTEQVARTDK